MFTNARAKINRAKKHITDMQARIASLPSSYTATIEVNPQGGNEVIKHDLSDVNAAEDIALMLGDAVHNLKCALDYAWVHTINKVAPSEIKFTKFPVYPTEEHLEAELRKRQIDLASPSLYRLLVSEIKPYSGGNDAVRPVHELDRLDKHNLLIPTIYFASIGGIKLENEAGEVEYRDTWGTMQNPPYYVPIPRGWHIKEKGKVAVDIIFGDTLTVRHFNVADMLCNYLELVLKVVELMEKLCEG